MCVAAACLPPRASYPPERVLKRRAPCLFCAASAASADEVADVYAGLVGALVIGRKGALKEDLTPVDVDRCGAWFGAMMGCGWDVLDGWRKH